MHKICPFCHAWMSTNIFEEHVASHTRLLADGQMKDHVTVRPEARFAGDIAKEPRWYIHPRCGGVTGMPEEIIRSYMVDPFLYNESSFCTGCHNYVPTAELYWQETNESLQAASYRRKAEFIQKNGLNPNDFVWDAHGPARRKQRGVGAGLVAVLAVGGLAATVLLGFVGLVGFLSIRSHAAGRQAPPPRAVEVPGFDRDLERVQFPDIPQAEIPKGPDIQKMMRESRERLEKQLEESRQRQEELMERLRADPLGPPRRFGSSPESRPTDAGIEGARQRSAEAHQRATDRVNEIRQRMKNRP